MEINLSKKHFTAIAALGIILAAGFAVANQDLILKLADPILDKPAGSLIGHSSADVVVSLADSAPCNAEMSLQQAIDNGCFGAGGGGICSSFDSGWMAVTSNDILTLNHNLGTTAIFVEILWAPDSGGSPDLSKVAKVETTRWGAGALEMGTQILEIGNSSMKVYLADSYLSDTLYSGGYAPNTGHYRVLAISTDCGGGGGGTTLPNCASGRIVESDGSGGWVCADDDTGGAGGSLAFGAWVNVTAVASGGAVQGPATSDGFVVIGTDDWGKINAFTDSDNPPTRRLVYNTRDSVNEKQFTMPVRKGDYWRTTGTSISSVNWLPIVDGGGAGAGLPNCPSGQIVESDGSGGWVCADDDEGGAGETTLPNCASGKIVESDGSGGWICADDDIGGGAGSPISCQVIIHSSSPTCPAGTTVTGGGFDMRNVYNSDDHDLESYPSGNGWNCASTANESGGIANCYAVCCSGSVTVTGSIIGSGYVEPGDPSWCMSVWGDAYCHVSGEDVYCTSGTRRVIGRNGNVICLG